MKKRRGFTLVELLVGLSILTILGTVFVSQLAAATRLMIETRNRAAAASEFDKSIGVVEAWINRAHSAALVADRDDPVGSDSGPLLRLNFSDSSTAWVTVTAEGLTLETTFGETILLSSSIGLPSTGPVFARTSPTSPWTDAPSQDAVVYTAPFSGAGIIVLSYSESSGTTRQRGFAHLGL